MAILPMAERRTNLHSISDKDRRLFFVPCSVPPDSGTHPMSYAVRKGEGQTDSPAIMRSRCETDPSPVSIIGDKNGDYNFIAEYSSRAWLLTNITMA
jgi:hypothetical protein